MRNGNLERSLVNSGLAAMTVRDFMRICSICVPRWGLVISMAPSTQALITLGLPSVQPAHLSSTYLTNKARYQLRGRILLFWLSFDDYS
jgi:hypothetical protein